MVPNRNKPICNITPQTDVTITYGRLLMVPNRNKPICNITPQTDVTIT